MRYHSQFSEDAIIDGLFRKIGTTNKLLVDVGAANGITFSNTRFFMEGNLRGRLEPWNGHFVEPDRERFNVLTTFYPESQCSNIAIDSTMTIDKLLDSLHYPEVFDLLNIDIDGQDYYIWTDMIKYRARIVVIEWSPYVTKGFIPKRDTDGKEGENQAGILSMLNLARRKDYTVVAITPVNLICVDNKIIPQKYWKGCFPLK